MQLAKVYSSLTLSISLLKLALKRDIFPGEDRYLFLRELSKKGVRRTEKQLHGSSTGSARSHRGILSSLTHLQSIHSLNR